MIVTLQNIQPVTVVSYDVSFDNETWRVELTIINHKVSAITVKDSLWGHELVGSDSVKFEKWTRVTNAAQDYHSKMAKAWSDLLSEQHKSSV